MAKPTPLLSRRRAARFAAVQALYQIEVGGAAAATVVAEFGDHRLARLLDPHEGEVAAPAVDREWFAIVAEGAWAARERLDPEIERCLATGWTLARCGYLVRACLRAGAFELAERTDVPVKVATKVLFGAMDQMATSWVLGKRRYRLSETADAVATIFLRGVSANGV